MESDSEKKFDSKPNNPHDRFAKLTVGNPLYAADFLKHYADPIVAEHVNLDHLVAAPTHFLTQELKEIILDITFVARLQDIAGGSEVLIFLEHKSKPSKLIPLQLLAQATLSLYFGWTTTNYSETYKPAIPLMLVLYNGDENLKDEIFFQDIFSKIPEKLRPLVPQFRIVVINLKRFHYGHLPGNPVSQAIAESLKRATDGTFGDQLGSVLRHFVGLEIDQQIQNLIAGIATYCSWASPVTAEQIVNTIKTTITNPEGIQMTEAFLKDSVLKGIEIGELKGELKGKVKTILAILQKKFKQVPQYIVDSLNRRTDTVALESLAVLAATCSSLDEFIAEL